MVSLLEPKYLPKLKVSTKDDEQMLRMWEEVRTIGKHPARRSYHSAVMWGDKMLIFGGQDLSEGPQRDLWSIEIGQFGNESWEHLQIEDKGNLSRHSAIIKNSTMYIFGGTTGSEEFNKTLALDLKTLAWKEYFPDNNLPPPLDSHTACLYEKNEDSFMVVFGGFANGERTNEVYILNLLTMKWTHVDISTTKPGIRSGHSGAIYNDGLYIFGGISDEGEKLNDFWRFDLSSHSWQEVLAEGERPTGRSGHSSVVYKDVLIIFGGMKDITKETNDMYSYNFTTNIWTLFQYEHQVRDPVSPDQLEEFKKTKANLAALRAKNANSESPLKTSPLRKPTFTDSAKGSPVRRPTLNEGEGSPFRRRKTLYEGPLNPTEGRIKGKLPHPRDGHSAVVNGDIMIIFGGDRHQMPFNDTYVYYLVEENIKTPVSALN